MVPKKPLSATTTLGSDDNDKVAGSGSNQLDHQRVQRATVVAEKKKTTREKARVGLSISSVCVFLF